MIILQAKKVTFCWKVSIVNYIVWPKINHQHQHGRHLGKEKTQNISGDIDSVVLLMGFGEC